MQVVQPYPGYEENTLPWRNRIVGHGEEDPAQLLANPLNWRVHPTNQQEALLEALDKVGWVTELIVNRQTGHVVDGHLRMILADRRGEARVPVQYVDLTLEEEKLVLATLDPLSALASTDQGILAQLVADLPGLDKALGSMLRTLAPIALPGGGVDPAVAVAPRPTLADRFVVPPFTVLDARQGYWIERKRAWIAAGVRGEGGRGVDGNPLENGLIWPKGVQPAKSYEAKEAWDKAQGGKTTWDAFLQANPEQAVQAGTSVFDPVLAEVLYRWFSPPGGHVLDPFAGGATRGVMAAMLGRSYTGVEVSGRQIAANEAVAGSLGLVGNATSVTVPVKISAKMARLLFNGCQPDYIANVCHAACGKAPTRSTGTLITIHPSEQAGIEALGGVVTGGLLQPRPGERRCPFEQDNFLCSLHGTPHKPFGCVASPLTLNEHGTVIVRNRYKLLPCYNDGQKLPAYQAFRGSYDLLLGAAEAKRVCDHLDAGGDDIIAQMPRATYQMLRENDGIKQGQQPGSGVPMATWVAGDSARIGTLAPGLYDMICTCPPYADLERYSTDPGDLSALPYPQFIAQYRQIVDASCALLAPDRFAAVVVGDVRDKGGVIRPFVSDTIQAFCDAGMAYYNAAVFLTPNFTAPIRAGKQFSAGRKLARTHQYVLVFAKGDPQRAADACGPVTVEYPPGMEATAEATVEEDA